jgi:signal transduction histidine kinase
VVDVAERSRRSGALDGAARRSRRGRALDSAAVVALALAAAGSLPLAYLGSGHPNSAATAVVWAATALQLLATPVVLTQRRWPVGGAALIAAVVVAGLLPLVATADPLVVRFSTVNLWPPLALSGAVIALRRHASSHRATGVRTPRQDASGRRATAIPAPRRDASGRGATVVWVLIAAATVLAARPWQPSWAVTPVGLLHTAVPALLGLYLASRWQVLDGLRERAELAERERVLLAERARAEERARLAGELHDSVAHRVSLMVLQAGALRLTSTDQTTRDAAEHLRATGCQALEELSELLGVLRRPEASPTSPLSGTAVEAGAVGLAELVAESEGVGLPVVLEEDGDPAAVSVVVRRTAYRVVQEALTNVHKHAPGAKVEVTARYGVDRVVVRVRNEPTAPAGEGAGLPVTGGGTGLLGLARRVEAVGGSLRAGRDRDGGFRVEATMPLRETRIPAREATFDREGSMPAREAADGR